MAYLFVIGTAVGYVIGIAIGAGTSSSSLPILISVPPTVIIVASFILLNLVARSRTNRD